MAETQKLLELGPLATAFRQEETEGLKLLARARAGALSAVAAALILLQPWPYGEANAAMVLAIVFNGVVHYQVARRTSSAWPHYVFPPLDFILLMLIAFVINPLMWDGLRPEMLYSFAVAGFGLLLLTTTALLYAPGPVLSAGVFSACVWLGLFYWIVRDPAADNWLRHVLSGGLGADGPAASVPRMMEALLFVLVAGVLALSVRRARRLVLRQAAVARERANLSRYFSPNVVEQLARHDRPFDAVRQQHAAVMFVDVIGFTALSEDMLADDIVRLLRDFHARLSDVIFSHGGTVDKFLGDGVMATFGTPEAADDDAARALRCARALAAREAGHAGSHGQSWRVAIGLHYGPVVVGDLGGAGGLEFAVIGDTVNVASRLEGLCRPLDARLVVSTALAEAARAQGAGEALDDIVVAQPQQVRNRDEPVPVLRLPR